MPRSIAPETGQAAASLPIRLFSWRSFCFLALPSGAPLASAAPGRSSPPAGQPVHREDQGDDRDHQGGGREQPRDRVAPRAARDEDLLLCSSGGLLSVGIGGRPVPARDVDVARRCRRGERGDDHQRRQRVEQRQARSSRVARTIGGGRGAARGAWRTATAWWTRSKAASSSSSGSGDTAGWVTGEVPVGGAGSAAAGGGGGTIIGTGAIDRIRREEGNSTASAASAAAPGAWSATGPGAGGRRRGAGGRLRSRRPGAAGGWQRARGVLNGGFAIRRRRRRRDRRRGRRRDRSAARSRKGGDAPLLHRHRHRVGEARRFPRVTVVVPELKAQSSPEVGSGIGLSFAEEDRPRVARVRVDLDEVGDVRARGGEAVFGQDFGRASWPAAGSGRGSARRGRVDDRRRIRALRCRCRRRRPAAVARGLRRAPSGCGAAGCRRGRRSPASRCWGSAAP